MLTNVQAAERLGCNPSTVSRIRSGDRTPGLDMVLKIEDRFRWSAQDQANSLRKGTYAESFNQVLAEATPA